MGAQAGAAPRGTILFLAILFLVNHVAQDEVGKLRHQRPKPGVFLEQ